MTKAKTQSAFARDVRTGLSTSPKHLSSKYFYDDRGSAIFQKIMQLDEYYLTNAEFALLDSAKADYLQAFGAEKQPFRLIELGAGDGSKTKLLLRHFCEQGADFEYWPVDISQAALQGLQQSLKSELPDLEVQPMHARYEEALQALKTEGKEAYRNIVLFMGSNIGNFQLEQAQHFLQMLHAGLQPNDALIIGVDLKKAPRKILRAYDDAQGVTAAFNKNVLQRINNELGGHFELDTFEFYPSYHPQTGEVRSYLLSTCAQTVQVDALETAFHFEAWEAIHTEISKKYSLSELAQLAVQTGFTQTQSWKDEQGYFTNVFWLRE